MTHHDLHSLIHGPPARFHLLGVSGSGMSGIAALLLALGHRVSGSDRADTAEVRRLVERGLDFACPYRPGQMDDSPVVIYSSAVRSGNPGYDEAIRRSLPMFRRAEALAALMAGKRSIVVCGMHGKTTTSAMLAHVLRAAGAKPSHYVGAEIPILGSNARWDSDGDLFVAEGDESDGTLALYEPDYAIILNVEPEHLDFYQNLEQIDQVFRTLVSRTRSAIVACADDPGATRVSNAATTRITYGTAPSSDYRMLALRMEEGRPLFRIREHGSDLGEIHLGIPGRHNALNALAVIAISRHLGIEFPPIADALQRFQGARRRFETLYKDEDFWVVDDYGHHPTEIAATLDTARLTGKPRTVVLFQPHRYTRTLALQKEFGSCFRECEILAVTEIYAASEHPIPGVSGNLIVQSVQALHQAGEPSPTVLFEKELKKLPQTIGPLLREGDLILSLGAGNIHEAGRSLASDLQIRHGIRKALGPGTIRLYEPLRNHTTFKVGGPARFWVEPETEAGFAELVRFCTENKLPLLVLGRGSNLLVRDGGFHGVVAHLAQAEFLRCELDGNLIHVGAGVRLKQLAAFAKKHGLAGFEWMEGIPGSVGGALRMNAGAMGSQIFEQVVRVRFLDPDGNLFSKTPEEMEVYYRNVPTLQTNYAISATLRGTPAPPAEIERRMLEFEQKRKASQPIAASAGCIFKNPPTIPAGKLIDELGLKGTRIGGAQISEVHGNFIVNLGNATAKDILSLIEKVQSTAREQRGIELETEVQIIGED